MRTGVVSRVAVYGSVAVLAVAALWKPYLHEFAPLADASERFLAIAAAADEAAAAERRRQGEEAGLAAARAGKPAVYEYGLAVGSDFDYRDLLLARYGVKVHNVGCMPTAGKWDWQAGFTTAVERELRQVYGRDVLAECRRDARIRYDSRVKCE